MAIWGRCKIAAAPSVFYLSAYPFTATFPFPITRPVAYPGVPCHQAHYAIQDISPTLPVAYQRDGPMAHAPCIALASETLGVPHRTGPLLNVI